MAKSIFAALGASAPSMVFASEFTTWQTGAGLAEGFRLLGWDVAEVSSLDPLMRTKRNDLRVAAKILHPAMHRSHNQDIVAEAGIIKPNVFLTAKGNYITAATLKKLRRDGIFTVNFYPDRDFDHSSLPPDALDQFDLVATTKSYQMSWLTKRLGADRVAMIHHGYVPTVHRRRAPPGSSPQYLWDVCFIGNASPNKLAWLEPLARRFGDRDMIVAGNGWSKLAAGTALAPFVFGSPLHGDFFARATEHSRINIAVHHGAGGIEGWADEVSTRTFEIPACGGFMLHIDNEEVRSLFDVTREIDVFSDVPQLLDKVRHHLSNDVQRQIIANAGHARAVPAYSLHTRASQLANEIVTRGGLSG